MNLGRLAAVSQHAVDAIPGTQAQGSESWPVIAGYVLVSEIAAGGMATVYLARPTTGPAGSALVAIKYCHPHLRHDPTFVAMFLDEARLASLIRHPNVVATLDVGNVESLYFVMQYVEGVSLAEWLAHLGTVGSRIEVPLLLRVVVDTLSGLSAAHALTNETGEPLRLVHRDVSPQNILVGLDGVSKIGDFGIAKAESRATRTRTGQVKGKAGYMSPEQILLEPLDARADLYAVGVVLWEALTGCRLFDGDSDAATINLVLSGKIPTPSSIAGTDLRLDAVVHRALAFEPERRFADAEAMAQAIFTTGIEIATTDTVGADISALFGAKLQSRYCTLTANNRQIGRRQKRYHLRALAWLLAITPLCLGIFASVSHFVASRTAHPSTPTASASVYPPRTAASTNAPRGNDQSVTSIRHAPSPSAVASSPRPTIRQRSTRPPVASMAVATAGQPTPSPPHSSTSAVTTPRNRARPSEYRPNDL